MVDVVEYVWECIYITSAYLERPNPEHTKYTNSDRDLVT